MSKLTRRSMLATGSVLAAAPLAFSTAAVAAAEPDPTYAAIERHRQAWAALCPALDVQEAAQIAGQLTDLDDDHPAELALRAVNDEISGSAIHLAQMQPTMAADIVAVMAYAREFARDNEGCEVFSQNSIDERRSLEAWLLTIEQAVASLALAIGGPLGTDLPHSLDKPGLVDQLALRLVVEC
jgi:hypothetical protein